MSAVEERDAAAGARTRVSMVVPVVVAVGFFMEGLDSTALTTALPQMGREFGATPMALSATLTAYLLSLAVFIPVSAWTAERFGARRTFATALMLFVAGSVLCGLAPSPVWLIAMRALQGIGGALLNPVGRLIVARSFPKDQLLRAMTWVLIPGLLGPILGPTAGGLIVGLASWRWIFFVNVPVGLIGLMLARSRLPYIAPGPRQPFDILGFVLMGSGLVAAQLATDQISATGAGWPVAGLAALAALLLALYARHARRAAAPLIDLGLFRIRPFRIGVLTGLVARVGLFGPAFLMPLLFQAGLGIDPLRSGLLTGLGALGALTGRFGVPSLLKALGLKRALILAGLVQAALLVLFALAADERAVWALAVLLLAIGVVRTAQMTGLNTLAIDVAPDQLGHASTIHTIGLRLSQSLAIAAAAALLAYSAGGGTPRTTTVFLLPFLVLASINVICLVSFIGLGARDGDLITGRHAPDDAPA